MKALNDFSNNFVVRWHSHLPYFIFLLLIPISRKNFFVNFGDSTDFWQQLLFPGLLLYALLCHVVMGPIIFDLD